MTDAPDIVLRAQQLALQAGFPLTRQQARQPGTGLPQPSACLPGVGRFLAVLAAGCAGGIGSGTGGGVIGELGTGVGIGAAWMASAMPAGCRLITAEIDEARAAAARQLFAADHRVEVIRGDATTALAEHGPFDLVFADCGIRDGDAFADVIDLLRLGGRVVMDDVTPQAALAADSPYLADDAKRGFFANPRLISAEVVLPDLANSLLVGTRIA